MRAHKAAVVVLLIIAVVVVLQVKAARSPADLEQDAAWIESDSVELVEPQTPPEPPAPAAGQQPEASGEHDSNTAQPPARPESATASKPEPKPRPESKPQLAEKAPQSPQPGAAETGQEKPAPPAPAASESKAPAALPRMVDVGAGHCIPCKMMEPILDELRREYTGKVSVRLVNLEQDPQGGERYGVQVIPTQIFFDSDGQEVYRHVGYYSKEEILAKFRELGFIN